ncbi:DNA translocase FtsK [Shouchella patagoniensis]|uniref:DNA translocase FtsK n=1 Tax=Shouchella patagoniensis TaxID=228576 RepID=UPI0009956E05|nr:DNA translocase FtsK [Shouchella patagoniensis]
MSVWNKWLEWFKREDESHETLQESKEIKAKTKRNSNSEVELEEARMTYQYVKQEFEISRNKQKNNKEEGPPKKTKVKQGSDSSKKAVPEEETSFFKGHFKPSIIPSPVHGIQKREQTRENSDYDWLISQTREQQAEFVERLFHKPETSISGEPAYLRKITQQVEADSLVPEKDRNEYEMIAKSVISEKEHTYEEEQIDKNSSFFVDDETEYTTKSNETEQKNDTVTTDQEKTIESEEIEVLTEEHPDLNKKIINEREKEDTNSVQSHQGQISRNENKQKEQTDNPILKRKKSVNQGTIPQKGEIPFNVLMLPKDKQSSQDQTKRVKRKSTNYDTPPIHLLSIPEKTTEDDSTWLDEQATLLEETLASFHVDAKVVDRTKGPAVTRFEIQPAKGVKVNKITNLTDDIKLALAAKDIRMEAPIPGKNAIGIEVPNLRSSPVMLREILRRDVFREPESPLTAALGLDISGQPIVTDLKKMPHGLVAGATGSGKSVCINSILVSLLYKASPEELKLLLVDPKMVELAPYHDVPHLLAPVITDPKQATAALKWVVQEMERRYELFSKHRVRDIGKYNERYSSDEKPALPYILVVIDELADLMMVSPQDVEDAICRIAQKARACGIHLLVATQRPSVDVITGLIKANIPTRIAFAVASQMDSRTILDMGGAERLLGRGDMLFHENGAPKAVRVQGTFVSDEEIEAVVDYAKQYGKPEYAFDTETIQKNFEQEEEEDELLEEACYFAVEQGTTSASSIQRRFRVGYNRAARLIEMMEARGIVSGAMGSKPRQVLVTVEEIDLLFASSKQTTGT